MALAVLGTAMPAIAQDAGGSQHSQPTKDPHIIDLDFRGGSLEAYVKALRKAAGDQPVNIMLDPAAAELPVPEIILQEIDAYTALKAVERDMKNPIRLDDGTYYIWTVNRIGGSGVSVYQINGQEVTEMYRRATPALSVDRTTTVHSIIHLIAGEKALHADEVLSALQASLAFDGEHEAELRYHEDTGLLFARVTHPQADVIQRTLNHLELSVHARQQSREHQSRSEIEDVLRSAGASSIKDLVERVRSADNLRNRVLELQSRIAELQNKIINLQTVIDRQRAAELEGNR